MAKVQPAILAAAVFAFLSPIAEAIMVGDPLPVIVQEVNVDPGKIVKIEVENFYTGYTYPGVINLLVDGKPMDGFCIDPYHFSSTSPLQYFAVPLSQAPKAPGTMDSNQALLIGALWALAYSPTITADAAAGLQLAIWEVIGGDDFTLLSSNDYGAAALLAQAKAYTGPQPTLIGLTGPGQDYVVQLPPRVPDGGFTMLMLGISLCAIAVINRRYARAC